MGGRWRTPRRRTALCIGVDIAGSALLAGVGIGGLVRGIGRVPARLAGGALLALGATFITGVLTGVILCSGLG
jgi:hypothetical protein